MFILFRVFPGMCVSSRLYCMHCKWVWGHHMMSFKQSHLSKALYAHGLKPTLDVLLEGHGFVVPQCKHQEKQWVAVFQSIAAPKQRTFDLAGASIDGGRLYSRSVFVIKGPMRGSGMAWPLLKLLFAVTWPACSDNACLCTENVSLYMWELMGNRLLGENRLNYGKRCTNFWLDFKFWASQSAFVHNLLTASAVQ